MSTGFAIAATTFTVGEQNMSGRVRVARRRRHSQISSSNQNGSRISSNSTQTLLHTSDYNDFDDEGLFNSILDRIANQYRTTQYSATSKSFISSIPIIEITASLLKSASISCSICKDDYAINDKVTQLPCNHVFHHECIVPWLNRSNSCPLCRFKLPVERRSEQLMNSVVRLENSYAEGPGEGRENGFSVPRVQGGSPRRIIRVTRRFSSLSLMGQAVTGSGASAIREVRVDGAASGFANGAVSAMLDEDGDTVMLDA